MINDHLVQALLAKCWKDEKVEIEPGEYELDRAITVRLKGTYSKGFDQQIAPTVSIPLIPTLALFMSKTGIKGERAAKLLRESIAEALEAGNSIEESISEQVTNVEVAIAIVRKDVLSRLPKVTRSGSVHVRDLDVEIINNEDFSCELDQLPYR